MERLAGRRRVLLAIATVAVGVASRGDTGQPADVDVTIGFEGGEIIPKGQLAVYLDGPDARGDRRSLAAGTTTESDGGSRKISVSLSLPPGMNTSSPQQIVARLQRPDGWLLARGSAQLEGGSPVLITLHTVMH
ncbi:hypothetical protein [Paracoccus benzoatiresistens]|uniref:Uncharacterized protein n=1 Tax=Paracoccus benzoatiresistens TaxID=2997341 RepID=A0ABT4J7Q2_9RHOB|nr:hypothetical protein [Paracoccus sp. EF6]MCZ0963134.1 hypothetical protein [Paracoccus sp. EF6]